MRILDSFGTWPEYNDPSYPFKIQGGRSGWANMNMLMPQYLTLYREFGSLRIYNLCFSSCFPPKKINSEIQADWGLDLWVIILFKNFKQTNYSVVFYTKAHTQDNTFLGFVVGSSESIAKSNKKIVKENKAILYAKYLSYCQSKVFGYFFFIFFHLVFIIHNHVFLSFIVIV